MRDVCKFCLSVGPYVYDTIIYKCYSNLRIPSMIDCSFEQYIVSRSQTAIFSFMLGRDSRPNIKEKIVVWLRETRQYTMFPRPFCNHKFKKRFGTNKLN